MKKIIINTIAIIAIIAVVVIVSNLGNKIESLRNENIRLKSNQEAMLDERKSILAQNQIFKVSDSLNAAEVTELQLSLSEYKRHRNEDLKLINQLKIDKSGLQKVISSQTETINNVSTKLTDTIRISIGDTIKHFEYKSKWSDITGYVDLRRDTIELQMHNRESLKIIETVKYKRFLGFLWKTNTIKSRQVNVISENPNTTIVDVSYINISGKQ